MLTPDEEMQSRSGCDGVPRPCANCGHPCHLDECEYERGDTWVEGNNCGGWAALPPCGCTRYEPMTADDIIDQEHPESI